jgi:N-acetyl sugar amidotransferase
MKNEYQTCKRCVMDTTDPKIEFDENGTCNHCKKYDEFVEMLILPKKERKVKLEKIIEKIKQDGKGKKYDCIVGVSGGVDSTYVAYLAKKFGLRPLAIHLDNGWNSELAVGNIERVLNELDIDLYTHVIDWKEFKDLQLSYFKASVVDIEVATDHAILAMMYKIANEMNIKYILIGVNVVTEGIMPKSWVYVKKDLKNLKSIHKKFGSVKLKTFPKLSLMFEIYCKFIKGIRPIPLLNYIDYNRKEAKEILSNKLGWKDYGGKHHESIFTKFYQLYILPTKFNIDKRKAHLSTLICSGQISREDALKKLKESLYKKEELERDKEYVIKKLGLTNKEFKELMEMPIKSHYEYGSNEWLYVLLRRIKDSLNLFR